MQGLLDGHQKVGWNPAFRVEILDETIYLISENEKRGLKGKGALLLAPFLLEGTHSADDLVGKLEGRLSPEEVYLNLIELEKTGLVQSKAPDLEQYLAAYCGLLKVDGKIALQRLNATSVYLLTSDARIREEMNALLESLHIRLTNNLDEASISLVIVKDYLEPAISAFKSSKPWLLLKPFGSHIWLGPLFGQKEHACYQCMARRIQKNRLEETFIGQQKQENCTCPCAMLQTTQKMGLNLAVTELFKWVVTGTNSNLENKILTWNTLELKAQEHHVIKFPQCQMCGGKFSEKTPEIVLQSRKNESEYRCLSPEDTLDQFTHHVSPITGVVRFLESYRKVKGSVIHVYASGSNKAIPHILNGKGMNTFRTYCGGKGTTSVAAKASCLCESLERLSGEARGDESIIYSTYKELGSQAIHPNSIALFSEEQYANRVQINSISHHFNQIGVPFPEEERIPWASVWSLTEKCIKYVPFSCCYYSSTHEGEWKGSGHSNGCAAGNCLEEAILQGLFELVERDSVAIWWYNRLRYPEVDLNSFHVPYIQNVFEEYAQMGREAWVLDITTDLAIPSFVAISRLLKGPYEKIHVGFGTHVDAQIAILRALTEMNQFLGRESFWEEAALNEDKQEKIDREIVMRWMHEATIETQPYLKPEGLLTKSHYPQWVSHDLLNDIVRCQKIIESHGMEVLVLDQTRQDIGLNVARVIVPGLRYFWARFAPGRLYDVPVRMGKLKVPLKESELNPIAMFL